MLNFALIQIESNGSKYLPIFLIAAFLVFVLSCFIFIGSSLKKEISQTIDMQPDLIVQKIRSGKVVDAPSQWVDEFISIEGISSVNQRVYGKYFYEPAEEYFTIVGVDFYDEQIWGDIKHIVKGIDMESFLSKKHMLIGEGVKRFLDEYHFFKYYNFRPPDKSVEKVYIYDTFKNQINLIGSDMIIMDINLAKTILGIDEDKATDILIDVANVDETETIKTKIRVSHFDIRIISKEELYKVYTTFFNYRSSLFIILFFICMLTFIIILYQRYSLVNGVEKREIGTLRSLGWSINKVIKLKMIENAVVFLSAFIIGVNTAYIYVFIMDAPLLGNIFLGFGNLDHMAVFTPVFDFSLFVTLFIIFIVPVLASVLVPVWKISLSEPYEAMR